MFITFPRFGCQEKKENSLREARKVAGNGHEFENSAKIR
jgi:hypothetical protein